jgi:sugar phosphate isomerase/epimerase
MSRLLVFQSVWAMDGLPDIDLEARPEQALARIAAAGFDGAGVNIVRTRRAEATARVMAEHGLTWEAQALVHDASELARHIDAAHTLGGAHHFNVQIAAGAATLAEALTLIDSLEAVAATAPMPVFYETHRGRLTNDLYFTGRILDARPGLKLTGDLSHYVTTHEMALPVDPDIERRMSQVIGACQAFHARVAGPHQVQIGLDAAQNRGWLDTFTRWWADGVFRWRARAGPDDTLAVMCELGPPPYAMTNADGREFSDRWQDALALKEMFRELWRS